MYSHLDKTQLKDLWRNRLSSLSTLERYICLWRKLERDIGLWTLESDIGLWTLTWHRNLSLGACPGNRAKRKVTTLHYLILSSAGLSIASKQGMQGKLPSGSFGLSKRMCKHSGFLLTFLFDSLTLSYTFCPISLIESSQFLLYVSIIWSEVHECIYFFTVGEDRKKRKRTSPSLWFLPIFWVW